MFKVTKKPKTPNILWDASSNRPICKFVRGIFETNDEALAYKLKGMGYTVEGGADAKPLDKMKVEELRAYAAERNIELPEDAKKDEILRAIQEAEVRE